jgi:2-phosphosulfolactate phosphatase
MKIDVVPLPRMLTDEQVRDRVVVVFDVLRATTTIAAAFAAGAQEIRVFDSLDAAKSAAAEYPGQKLLCGESRCLPPPGFDLGNSPGAYLPEIVRSKTLFLSTTNGTRALVAARHANILLTGALVNASAIAVTLASLHHDVTLLCAGTDGEEAPEDLLGAGAVISELPAPTHVELTEAARAAMEEFRTLRRLPFSRHELVQFLKSTQGGKNVIQAGLKEDVEFAARVNAFDVVPRCNGSTLAIRRMTD